MCLNLSATFLSVAHLSAFQQIMTKQALNALLSLQSRIVVNLALMM